MGCEIAGEGADEALLAGEQEVHAEHEEGQVEGLEAEKEERDHFV